MKLRFGPLGKVRLILILAAVGHSPAQSQDSTLSVCSVVAGLPRHANRVLTVLGAFESGPEQFSLKGVHCETPFITEGYTWPSALVLRFRGGPETPDSLPFVPDSSSISAFQEALRRARGKGLLVVGCLKVTGMIQMRDDYSIITQPDGQKRGHGFGHMSACPAQLIIKSIEVKSLGSFPSDSGCQ